KAISSLLAMSPPRQAMGWSTAAGNIEAIGRPPGFQPIISLFPAGEKLRVPKTSDAAPRLDRRDRNAPQGKGRANPGTPVIGVEDEQNASPGVDLPRRSGGVLARAPSRPAIRPAHPGLVAAACRRVDRRAPASDRGRRSGRLVHIASRRAIARLARDRGD